MSTEKTDAAKLLDLTRQLLKSIADADWETYAALCDPSISAFEPEASGHLVEGMEFHRFYFDRGGIEGPYNVTIASPHVRVLGDAAIVSYVRLVQPSTQPASRSSANLRKRGSGTAAAIAGVTYTSTARLNDSLEGGTSSP